MAAEVKREPRRRMPRAERERQMLEVAADEFARRGYDGAAMDVIAARAGITKPMLYAYFGSKEGLFAATAERAGDRLRETVRAVVTTPGLAPDERLWRGLRAVFAFVDEHRDAWRLLYPGGRPGAGPIGAGAARARDAMAELVEELFADVGRAEGVGAQAAAQAALMAPAFTAATIGAASAWLDSDEPRDLAALRLMNFVWSGFGDLLEGRMWLPSR